MMPDLPALSLGDIGYTWIFGLALWLGVAVVAVSAACAVFGRKARKPWPR
ncbi:MAG TPA: hypothetical protein VNT81_23920 [Vicinamibacterales bacterium]|nr:hypothetical protein [Vicinamibacterales bacterium]